METTELDKALQNLTKELKQDLVKKIKQKGHQGTGALEKSIKLKVVKSEGKHVLQFESNLYLKFLDKGKFLKDWLKEADKKIMKQVADATVKDILNTLNI